MIVTWVDPLRAAIAAEFGAKARIASLATMDPEGRPRVRSVVCRRVHDDGSLWVASDARSDKNHHARSHPFGEMAFWLPGRREQFRVGGTLAVFSSGEERSLAWAELSDTARALFFWDPPGAPKLGDDLEVPGMVDARVPTPESFELLILRPDRAEYLDLKLHPHRRLRWERSRHWAVEEINP